MGCAFPEDILSQAEAAGWDILRPGRTETRWLRSEGEPGSLTPGWLILKETVSLVWCSMPSMLDGRQSHTAPPTHKGDEGTLKR